MKEQREMNPGLRQNDQFQSCYRRANIDQSSFYFSSQLCIQAGYAEQVITTGHHEENPVPRSDIVRNQQSSTTVLYFLKDGPPLASF